MELSEFRSQNFETYAISKGELGETTTNGFHVTAAAWKAARRMVQEATEAWPQTIEYQWRCVPRVASAFSSGQDVDDLDALVAAAKELTNGEVTVRWASELSATSSGAPFITLYVHNRASRNPNYKKEQ